MIIVLIVSGCAGIKKANQTAAENQYVIEGTQIITVKDKNLSENNFFVHRADVIVKLNGQTERFTASLKFKIPDTILVSVKSIAGIEAARIFLTGDTVLINDRINRQVLFGDPGDLKLKYGLEPELLFLFLGDMIIGDEMVSDKLFCKKGFSEVTAVAKGKRIKYIIDCKRNKVLNTSFSVEEGSTTSNLFFSEFVKLDKTLVPRDIKIQSAEGKEEINIKLGKIDTDWSGQVRFYPSQGYKLIKIR